MKLVYNIFESLSMFLVKRTTNIDTFVFYKNKKDRRKYNCRCLFYFHLKKNPNNKFLFFEKIIILVL